MSTVLSSEKVCGLCNSSIQSKEPNVVFHTDQKIQHFAHRMCVEVWANKKEPCPTCEKRVFISKSIPEFVEDIDFLQLAAMSKK